MLLCIIAFHGRSLCAVQLLTCALLRCCHADIQFCGDAGSGSGEDACMQFGQEKAETVSGTEPMPEVHRWAKHGRGGSAVLVFSCSLVALLPVTWYVMTSPTRPPQLELPFWGEAWEAWIDGSSPLDWSGRPLRFAAAPARRRWHGRPPAGRAGESYGPSPRVGPNWMWPSCYRSPRGEGPR
jgi:hypothetical protein